MRLDDDGVIHADLDGKLSTARKIAITGDATGAIYFDGSKDETLWLTVLKAQKDGDGNLISETYAKKADLTDFITINELTTIFTTLDDETVSREEVAALFD